jgi:hypothetical protein
MAFIPLLSIAYVCPDALRITMFFSSPHVQRLHIITTFLTTKNRKWHQVKMGIFKEIQHFEKSKLGQIKTGNFTEVLDYEMTTLGQN